MLVLSRKPQETILFPNLGITVEIVRVAGGRVRVGIDAPADVPVVRGELVARPSDNNAEKFHSLVGSKARHHRLRNQVHTAGLSLTLLEKQLAAGKDDDAEATLAKALELFRELDLELHHDSGSAASKPTRRALLVEDDKNEAELLAGILRISGYEVETAPDGLVALEVIKHQRPDFVLLDMNLPRCDGATTLAAIRSNPAWRDLRVFAVTGSSQRELGFAPGQIGVDRWFQKPLDPAVLLGAMNELEQSNCLSA